MGVPRNRCPKRKPNLFKDIGRLYRGENRNGISLASSMEIDMLRKRMVASIEEEFFEKIG